MVTARTPVWSLSAPRLLSPARLLRGDTCEVAEARGARGALVATAGERRYCTPALGGSGGFRHLPTGHRGAPGRGRANGQDSSRPAPRGGNSHRTASRSCLAHIHPSPAAFRRIGDAPHTLPTPTPHPPYPCRPLPLLASWSLLTCHLLRGDHPDHCIVNNSLFPLHYLPLYCISRHVFLPCLGNVNHPGGGWGGAVFTVLCYVPST